jgi:hypothetical protein
VQVFSILPGATSYNSTVDLSIITTIVVCEPQYGHYLPISMCISVALIASGKFDAVGVSVRENVFHCKRV